MLLLFVGCQAREHEFVPADEYAMLTGAAGAAASGDDCPTGQERCGQRCRDVQNDPRHCGECGNVCESGACLLGSCLLCRLDEEVCDGACVAVDSDAEHCGGCGIACGLHELCDHGVCGSACPEGKDDCNAGCVDTGLDPRNCGECGNVCPDGRLCSDGKCRSECAPPLEACDGACRDVSVDSQHCGGCDRVCTPSPQGGTTTCVDGECLPSSENCQNGEDDNDDGLRDCEDPSCDGYRCVPRSPAGWSEPFVLVTGDDGAAPRCPSSLPKVVVSGLHQGLQADAAECSCECQTTVACRVDVSFYDDAGCWNEPWDLTSADALTSGVCESVYFEREGTAGAIAIWPETKPERQTADNTTCTLTSPPLEPPTWDVDAIGCAPEFVTSAGCNQGTCVAREPSTRYCVSQQGNQSCPAGFPDKQLMHTDYLDDRSCGECECDLECSDAFLAYTDEECSVDEQAIPANTPCSPLAPDGTPELDGDLVYETRSFMVDPPTCDPTSKPSGSATASGSVTVCCEAE